jgi:signal transduction histidine kinase
MTAAIGIEPQKHSIQHAAGVDIFMAYGAGPQAWNAGTSEWSIARTSASVVGLLGIALMAVVTGVVTIWNPLQRVVRVRVELGCLGIVGLLILSKSLVGVLLQREDSLPVGLSLGLRALGFAAFLTSWVALTPQAAAVLLFPIGLFGGADIGLTAHLVGYDRSTMRISLSYLRSPVHLGAIAAVAAIVAFATNSRLTAAAINVLLAVEMTALLCVISAAAVRRLFQRESLVTAQIRDEQRSEEHHRRAHWIHDDVCADIRGLRLKVTGQAMSPLEVEKELEELDHRLRLRQLDEVIAGGTATAAEVLQPYLRKLQHQGILLTTVPHFDESAYEVHGATAEFLQRCAAGLTSNAVAAGATAVGFRLHSDHTFLALTVTDNAGGFRLDQSPAGRGLSRLAMDLRPGSLSVEQIVGGSAVTANIPLEVRKR